jgi:hypothetical protein
VPQAKIIDPHQPRMRIDRIRGCGQLEEVGLAEPLQRSAISQRRFAGRRKVGAHNRRIVVPVDAQHGVRVVMAAVSDAYVVGGVARADVGIPDGCLW